MYGFRCGYFHIIPEGPFLNCFHGARILFISILSEKEDEAYLINQNGEKLNFYLDLARRPRSEGQDELRLGLNMDQRILHIQDVLEMWKSKHHDSKKTLQVQGLRIRV